MTAHINRPHTGNCPSIRILAPVCRLFQPTERGNEDNEIAEQNNSPDKSPGITRSVHQAARWRALSPEMTIRALFIRASSASDLNLFVFLIRNFFDFYSWQNGALSPASMHFDAKKHLPKSRPIFHPDMGGAGNSEPSKNTSLISGGCWQTRN
jgi:hypothetical protein